jgi:hypothetical protein
MKMGIEAGDVVDLLGRRLGTLGKGFQLCFWQVPVAQLDGSQFVKNHGGMSRETAPHMPTAPGALRGSGY